MWWALRLYFAGFDDLMPVVGGAVWVFHNVIPVVKLLTVTVPTKLNLPPKKRTIKIAIHKVLGNISLHIQHFKWRKGTVFSKNLRYFFLNCCSLYLAYFLNAHHHVFVENTEYKYMAQQFGIFSVDFKYNLVVPHWVLSILAGFSRIFWLPNAINKHFHFHVRI